MWSNLAAKWGRCGSMPIGFAVESELGMPDFAGRKAPGGWKTPLSCPIAAKWRPKLFHVEQFGPNGKALENFVASGFVLLGLQLRKIMPFCALLQRMGIFGGEREISRKFRAPERYGAPSGANPYS